MELRPLPIPRQGIEYHRHAHVAMRNYRWAVRAAVALHDPLVLLGARGYLAEAAVAALAWLLGGDEEETDGNR